MDNNKMPSDAQFRLQLGELSAQGLRDAKAGYMMAQSEVEALRKDAARMSYLDTAPQGAVRRDFADLPGVPDAIGMSPRYLHWGQHSSAPHKSLRAAIDAAMAEGER